MELPFLRLYELRFIGLYNPCRLRNEAEYFLVKGKNALAILLQALEQTGLPFIENSYEFPISGIGGQ